MTTAEDLARTDSETAALAALRPLRRRPPRRRLCPRGRRVHGGAALRSQWDRGTEVELIRRADLVDLSDGLIRFGLSREWIRDLFKAVSRDGTCRTIGFEVARILRHRPLTFPQIFRR